MGRCQRWSLRCIPSSSLPRGYPPSLLVFRKILIRNGLADELGRKIFITKGLSLKILFLNELAPALAGANVFSDLSDLQINYIGLMLTKMPLVSLVVC